jgi:hypothetical protein
VTHFLFAYALCGVYVALVITTVDLFNPKSVQMGIGWTLFTALTWPVFVVVVVAYAAGWRPKRD